MLAEPTEPGDRLAREVDRVLTRLRALGPERLARQGADGAAPADLVRAALAAHALGDQLVVLTTDLHRAVDGRGPGPGPEVLGRAADRLVALRRAL